MELPEFPTEIDDLDPDLSTDTVLGRIRQWVRARRTSGLSGSTDKKNGMNDPVCRKTPVEEGEGPPEGEAQTHLGEDSCV